MCYMIDRIIMKAYQDWIDTHVPEDETITTCTIWTRVMREAFPELIHVGGS